MLTSPFVLYAPKVVAQKLKLKEKVAFPFLGNLRGYSKSSRTQLARQNGINLHRK